MARSSRNYFSGYDDVVGKAIEANRKTQEKANANKPADFSDGSDTQSSKAQASNGWDDFWGGVGNLAKTVGSSIQQGAGSLADIATQAVTAVGGTINNLNGTTAREEGLRNKINEKVSDLTRQMREGKGKLSDSEMKELEKQVQAGIDIANNMHTTNESLVDVAKNVRDFIHSQKDISGNAITGTSSADEAASDIVSGKGDIGDFGQLAATGLDVGSNAVMFANPVSGALKRGVQESAFKSAAKSVGGNAIVGAVGGGAHAAANDGDIVEGALGGAIAGGLLSAGGEIIGGSIRGAKNTKAKKADTAKAIEDAKSEAQTIAETQMAEKQKIAEAKIAQAKIAIKEGDAAQGEIDKLQNGEYPDSMYDVITDEGNGATSLDIQHATEVQLSKLQNQRDIISKQVNGIDDDVARQNALDAIAKLDDKIASIKDGDNSSIIQTTKAGTTKVLNTDRLRQTVHDLKQKTYYADFKRKQLEDTANDATVGTKDIPEASQRLDDIDDNGIYPEAVTPREDFSDLKDVASNPHVSETVRDGARQVDDDMVELERQNNNLMSRQRADKELAQLDEQHKAAMAEISKMPEARQMIEGNRALDKYHSEIDRIEQQVEIDAPDVMRNNQILNQMEGNRRDLLDKANAEKDADPATFGTVNNALNAEVTQQIEDDLTKARFNEMNHESGIPDSENVNTRLAEATPEQIEAGIDTGAIKPLISEATDDIFRNEAELVYNNARTARNATKNSLELSSNSHNLEKVFGEDGKILFGKLARGFAESNRDNLHIAKTLTEIQKVFRKDTDKYKAVIDTLEGKDVNLTGFNEKQIGAIDTLKNLYRLAASKVKALRYDEVVHDFSKRVARADSTRAINNGKVGDVEIKATPIKYTGAEMAVLAKRDGITLNEAKAKYGEIDHFKKSDIDYLAKMEADKATLDNYFPHFFDKDGKPLQFDASGEVKNVDAKVRFGNMLHRKSNSEDYSNDVIDVTARYFSALNKKYHLEPALRELDSAKWSIKTSDVAAEPLINYLNKYASTLKYRTQKSGAADTYNGFVDTLIHVFKKNSKSIGKDHYRNSLAFQRQINALAALGLNVHNGLQQVTQFANIAGEFGIKDTTAGIVNFVKNYTKQPKRYTEELGNAGVLHAGMAQDAYRSLENNMYKRGVNATAEKVGSGLMIMSSAMDTFARGSAYEASLLNSLRKGIDPDTARTIAVADAAKTNFVTSKVDMPLKLNGDGIRSLTQFLTFPLKQVERWKDMGYKCVKDADGNWHLDAKSMQRVVESAIVYGGVTAMMYEVAGDDPIQQVPFLGGGGVPMSPLVRNTIGLFLNVDEQPSGIETLINMVNPPGNDEFSKQAAREKARDDFIKVFMRNVVPAGGQIKKTFDAYNSMQDGGEVKSRNGNVQFFQDTSNPAKTLLFGKYSTEPAKQWVAKGFPTLSDKQSEIVDAQASQNAKKHAYDFYTATKQIPGKTGLLDNLKDIAKTQPARAQRLIQEHNDKVTQAMQEYQAQYGKLTEQEQKYLTRYYITTDNYNNLYEDDE